MGKGLAAQFKERYPAMFATYQRQVSQWRPGMICRYHLPGGKIILNVATKNHWKDPSRIVWIKAILHHIIQDYKFLGITSIALPKLGCGNGKLEWSDVGPIMLRALSNLPIDVEIYINEGDTIFTLVG